MENLNIQLFAAEPNAVIPSTEGRDGRSIDKVWKQSEMLSRAVQGALGLEFGNVLTIQEAGVKEENKLYLDSLDGRLYRCKKRTESLANTTALFELFSIKTNSDRLDNLSGKLSDHRVYYSTTLGHERDLARGNVLDIIFPIQDQIYKYDISFVLHVTSGFKFNKYWGTVAVPIRLNVEVERTDKDNGYVYGSWNGYMIRPIYDSRSGEKCFRLCFKTFNESFRGFGVRIIHDSDVSNYDILLEANYESCKEHIQRAQFRTSTIELNTDPDIHTAVII